MTKTKMFLCAWSLLGVVWYRPIHAATAWTFTTNTNGCGYSTLVYPNTASQLFRDALVDRGWPSNNITRYINASVQSRMLTDVSKVPYGQDSGFADSVDVFMFAGHSGYYNYLGADYVYLVMGSSANNCYVDLPVHVLWSGMRVALMYGSQTLQREAFDGGVFTGSHSGNRLKVIAGMHGGAYDRLFLNADFAAYGRNAQTSGVGSLWVDYFTNTISGSNECGTVIVAAPHSEVNDIFHNRGLNDFSNSTWDGYEAYYQVCGCTPAYGGPPLGC